MRLARSFVFAALPLAAFACSSFGASSSAPATPDQEAGVDAAVVVVADASAPELDAATRSTLTDGLIARWRFDEAGGTVAKNDVLAAPNGAIGTTKREPSGKLGGALRFDPAAPTAVTVEAADALDLVDAFTISLWVNLAVSAPTDNQHFVVRQPVSFELNGGHPQIATGASTATSTYVLPSNEWHQLTTTYSKGKPVIYVDGVRSALVDEVQSDEPLGVTGVPLYIGSYGDGTGTANGLLDDVWMWKRALTPDEVLEHHALAK